MYSVRNLSNGKKFVRFMSESVDNQEIYINTREELDELLDNYPSGAPRVVIGKDVKLSYLFSDFPRFKGDISNWDVSNVTNMYRMFAHSKFNGDISKWDVSNVRHMGYMFCRSVFNGDISNWNVSRVKDMSFMFCLSNFNGDISNWDVSNVKNMQFMFANSEFNGDISDWDVDNVKDMDNMFDYTPLKRSGNLPSWY